MSPMNNLFESLQVNTLSLKSQLPFLYVLVQKEFCPTIDASLVAALVVELELDGDGNSITPMEDKIAALRATLRELSLHADSELKIEYPEHPDLDLSAPQNDWTSASSLSLGNGNEESSGSSSSSSSDFAFVFLRTALPDVPIAKLKQALDKHERDNLDLWDVIATLRTEEFIRELEERGLDASENEERDVASSHVDRDMGWELVKKETRKRTARKNSDRRPKSQKIALTDIRQQHHVPSGSQHLNSPSNHTNGLRTSLFLSSPDPWTQLSSLATHLSSLLPPNSPSFFSSYFHSPKYPTSHDALRSALISLSNYDPSSDISEENTTLLVNILDIVMPSDPNQEFNPIINQRSRVISDVELAICATEGRANDALDLVYLLRELDNDSTMGLMHLPSPPSSPSRPSGQLALTNGPIMSPRPTRPSDSLPTLPIRRAKANSLPTFATSRYTKPSTNQWQVVPLHKKAIQLERRPHPNNIKGYTKEVNNHIFAGSVASTAGNFRLSREEMYDASHFRAKMRKAMARRDQALMDANILYKECKNRNREVALFYAEKVCINLLKYVYPILLHHPVGKRSTRTSEGKST